jgi:cytoskeletal protein CcmA (bactofilin family)
MKHFDEMTAFLYLDGQLEKAQAAEVRAHTAECAECRTLLTALENESKWLAFSLTEKDPVPARFAAPEIKTSLPWGWITVLGLAAGGVLTLWTGVVEPFQQQLDQAGFTGGNLMTMLFFSGAFWKGWSSVLNFLEYFSVAAVAMLFMVLLQRYWRRGATVGIVLAALAVMLVALPQPAGAAEVFKGTPANPTYTLPVGRTLNNDLYVFAESARIEGTVNGDVIAFGRNVQIDGHVTGDVISGAQELGIRGRVDGNVRSWSAILRLEGAVGKNVLSGGSVLDIGPEAQLGGALTAFGGTMEMDGHVARDFMGYIGETNIDGSVGGNVTLTSGRLRVTSNAQIQGRTEFKGDHPAILDPGARLGSPIEFTLHTHAPNYRSWRYYWHRAEFWGAAFVLGLVLVLLLPGFVAEGTRASGKFLPSLGIGAVVLIATPILAAIVCITIVGIGVAVATLLIYAIAVYAAQVFVATWLGNALLGHSEGTGGTLGRLALGLLIIQLVQMIPQHIGVIACMVVILWGLGAIAIASYRCLKPAATAAV